MASLAEAMNSALLQHPQLLEELPQMLAALDAGEYVNVQAIDSCPVNCIHYVSQEDLVTLEIGGYMCMYMYMHMYMYAYDDFVALETGVHMYVHCTAACCSQGGW